MGKQITRHTLACGDGKRKYKNNETNKNKCLGRNGHKAKKVSTWESGFMANSGTDKNSSAEINPLALRSSWQNLWYNDTISCWETEFETQFQILIM